MLVVLQNKLHLSNKHLPRQPEYSFLPIGDGKYRLSEQNKPAKHHGNCQVPGYRLLILISFYSVSLSTSMPKMRIRFVRMKLRFGIYQASFAAATAYGLGPHLPLIRYPTPSTSENSLADIPKTCHITTQQFESPHFSSARGHRPNSSPQRSQYGHCRYGICDGFQLR